MSYFLISTEHVTKSVLVLTRIVELDSVCLGSLRRGTGAENFSSKQGGPTVTRGCHVVFLELFLGSFTRHLKRGLWTPSGNFCVIFEWTEGWS